VRTFAWTACRGLAVAFVAAAFGRAIHDGVLHGAAPAAGLLVILETVLLVTIIRGWPASGFNPGVLALRRQVAALAPERTVRAAIGESLQRGGGDEPDRLLGFAATVCAADAEAVAELRELLAEAGAAVGCRRFDAAGRKARRTARRRAARGARRDPFLQVDARVAELDRLRPGFAAAWHGLRAASTERSGELLTMRVHLHLLSDADKCRLARVGSAPVSVLERAAMEAVARLVVRHTTAARAL
jgi:hypothetical protein